jgi:hypothetical protein
MIGPSGEMRAPGMYGTAVARFYRRANLISNGENRHSHIANTDFVLFTAIVPLNALAPLN